MLLAKQWTQECVSSHPKCAYKPGPLPKRVLHVGTATSHSRLYVSQGEKAEYVTLSHCWGPPESHPPKVLESTAESAIASLPLASLPKTFQDAILITRQLGIRYLWIDSLCILQDSPEDWEGLPPTVLC